MKVGAKASEWELQKMLKVMWQFVHDAPARRAMSRTYQNQQINQPAFVVTVGVRTKIVLKRQSH